MSPLDKLMGKSYDKKLYNCAHFAADVWLAETGSDISALILPLAEFRGNIPLSLRRQFTKQLETPRRTELAIVLMRTPRLPPHLGVYSRGTILQLHERGPERLPPYAATLGFKEIIYYVKVPDRIL